MEKLSQRESTLLGYSLQRSFTNPSSSPRAPYRNSDDVDFHDVFGGPPRRRSSVNEARYSFTETVDSFALRGGDGEAPPWSGLNEKPVFGEEGGHARRFPSDDFYDDIFKGDESAASSPRRDVFSSISDSRVLSPARPLPPPAEPFGSSSLPAQLSLPSRSAKGTDLPAFGSTSPNPFRNKDSVSNGSHTNSSRFALSRFSSSTSSHRHEDLKSDYNSSDRTGLLSSEFQHLSSEEASSFRKSDNTLSGNSSTKEVDSLEDSTAGGQFQFHFSIYKWASKGVPLMMPLRGGNASRLREKAMLRRSSSSTDRVAKEKNEMQSPTSTIHNIDFPPIFHETTNLNDEKGTGLLPDIDAEDQRRPGRSFEQTNSAAPSGNLSRQSSRKGVGSDNIMNQTGEKVRPRSLSETIPSEKAEKKTALITNEDQKQERKSLSSFLLYNDDEQGEEGISKEYRKEVTAAKSDKKSSMPSDLSSSPKKQDKKTSPRNPEVKKSSFQSSDTESGHNIGRKKVGGKISEFVKIFNQEPAPKSRDVVDSENDTSTRKQEGISKAQIEATVKKISKDEKEKPKLNINTDASIKVNDVLKQSVDDHSAKKTYSSNSSKEDSSVPVHIPVVSKPKVPDMEEPFQENFMVKELPQEYEREKAIDAKIQQWSNGKEGNIRSLLSTLQSVLWPKSGWKPVPLVDIIEGSAVKRSYQKALLYLHPDKLQQKGASSDQKYIAAKVFDILQEAWTHFSTMSGL
ncbi:J domain-containing protein required for chloroplast accumulation response 1 isoform X2 [Momordica charantia]|uniref:J domain-containing protein required for chloroplast accumulation response 1 isoform X2 n=1 Tax=Momordica charantia TaxID=3673 RepID=A0A6J1CJL4_MOMCH|nr:J domain-containing protein required for chloroplast accumulation response 1 isoform X2 [Momordica charantia]